MNIIETHQLAHRFGRIDAVQGLDLAVPSGSVCALLGPNGAGKTTTIRLLMNLLRPTAGSASVLGVDSRRLGAKELAQIGYVSENQELPRWMTVRQLLDYCRPFYPTWDRKLERTLLGQLELPEDRKLSELSRGMAVKAALLSSLAYRPRLLILDEPFSGLDPLVREELVRGVLEVSALGDWTVFICSHDVEEVERLADHVAMLDGGRLQLAETTESLLGRFRRMEVTGGPPGTKPPSEWCDWEQAGSLIRFVETGFQGEPTVRGWRERFPGATVAAVPLTLREIFIVLARSARNNAKGEAT